MALPTPLLQTNTAHALQPLAPLNRDSELRNLIDKIYKLAVAGNVTAAKLFLDYHLRIKSDDNENVSADEAYKILREFL